MDRIRRVLFSSSLSKMEYRIITDRLNKDNRDRLAFATCVIGIMFLLMFVLTYMVESIAHSRTIYFFGAVVSALFYAMSRLGKRHAVISTLGIYLFMDFALLFGIHQAVVTSPSQQTASFIALILAVPFWFGMIPIRMIGNTCLFAGIFIGCVLYFKAGAVQAADIVNAVIYSIASMIISTYATCTKARKFYAEYLTEQVGRTDTLTGLGNRTAFFAHESTLEGKTLPNDFTLWYMDLNELKSTNDMLGHRAGDEILKGAADCILEVYGPVATCYRIGGDEFIVAGNADEQTREYLNQRFEELVRDWKGSFGRPLRISCGFASAYEVDKADINSVASLAENRLYEQKMAYYETLGLDRHGHDWAYGALCESYVKIMKINLTDDTYKTIRTDIDDGFLQEDGHTCFSKWIMTFREMGYIHPNDEESYNKLADVDALREAFRSGKRTVRVFYRRKCDGEYHSVMTELMTAREYTDHVQIVYLYVKNIDA